MKNRIIRTLEWINGHAPEVCLFGVFVVSLLPFVLHGHGWKFYTFLGGWCSFFCMFFVWLDRKDEPRGSVILSIQLIIILILFFIALFFVEGKKDTDSNTVIELFLWTYFGSVMGIIFGGLVFEALKKEEREKKEN